MSYYGVFSIENPNAEMRDSSLGFEDKVLTQATVPWHKDISSSELESSRVVVARNYQILNQFVNFMLRKLGVILPCRT